MWCSSIFIKISPRNKVLLIGSKVLINFAINVNALLEYYTLTI